jgi:hypothetical protein
VYSFLSMKSKHNKTDENNEVKDSNNIN